MKYYAELAIKNIHSNPKIEYEHEALNCLYRFIISYKDWLEDEFSNSPKDEEFKEILSLNVRETDDANQKTRNGSEIIKNRSNKQTLLCRNECSDAGAAIT